MLEENGLRKVDMISLGDEFRAITTSAHLYLMKAYMIEIDDKRDVENFEADGGKLVWKKFDEAKDSISWAHSQLVLERAEKLLKEER